MRRKILSVIIFMVLTTLILASCGTQTTVAQTLTTASSETEASQHTISPLNTDEHEDSKKTTSNRVNGAGLSDPEGSYIIFGDYPQSLVMDESLTVTLTASAGSAEGDPSESGWNYYSNNYSSSGEFVPMLYKDIEYNGEKYRGVFFHAARTSRQKENGFLVDNYYWFKFEPIKWEILSENEGTLLLLSELALDSQCFYNYPHHVSGATYPVGNGGYYTDYTLRYFANNYVQSTIRDWLHYDFYDTAFSEDEKSVIIESEVDNSAPENSNNINDVQPSLFSGSTYETIFLLGSTEIPNQRDTDALSKKATDYAMCQGIRVASGSLCSPWWLRSVLTPYVSSEGMLRGGYVNGDGAGDCEIGVVPAVRVSFD